MKRCGEGFENVAGYVNGQGTLRNVPLAIPGFRSQNHIKNGRPACNSNPHGRGNEGLWVDPDTGERHDWREGKAPTCEKDPELEFHQLYCNEGIADEYKPFAAKVPLGVQRVYCIDPICAKLCTDDPECGSYETRPGVEGGPYDDFGCELNRQSAANIVPSYETAQAGQLQFPLTSAENSCFPAMASSA